MPSKFPITWRPGEPHPKKAARPTTAAIISHEVAPVTPRVLRDWPLTTWYFNGQAVHDVEEALAEARRRFAEAPSYRGGSSKAA